MSTADALRTMSLDRMVRAVEKVRERLRRAASALEAGGVPYAVIGGNAVAAWVSGVDEAAVRNTADVDILLRRSDLAAATAAVAKAGFIHAEVAGVDMFLDGPKGGPKDAVHLIFSGETVREGDPAPAPNVEESEKNPDFQVLSLEALVRMKLTSYRLKDQVHLQDLMGVGLINPSWVARFPAELGARLQKLLDNPNA